MRHPLIAAARRIAGELKDSEKHCDTALASHSRLLATMLDARVEGGLPSRTGRAALGRAADAIVHAAKAREMLLDAHDELAQLDMRELAAGDLSECPEKWFAGAPLAVVETDAQVA